MSRVDGTLPPVLHGVALPVDTACGIVSRSATQTGWTVQRARNRAPVLEPLTDADVLWLLLMGWAPDPTPARPTRPSPTRAVRS